LSETLLCPDCGASNPRDAEICAECGHPMAAEFRPRKPVHERPERVPASVASFGYRPAGARGSGLPGWMWAGIGIAGLAAVFITALQIANAPKPIPVPNADGPQAAMAESLSVLLHRDSTAVAPNVAMGNLMYDTGNFNLAIPYYTRALKGDPTLVHVQVDLAVSYHNSGEFEPARQTTHGPTAGVQVEHVQRLTTQRRLQRQRDGPLDADRPGVGQAPFDLRAGPAHGFVQLHAAELGIDAPSLPRRVAAPVKAQRLLAVPCRRGPEMAELGFASYAVVMRVDIGNADKDRFALRQASEVDAGGVIGLGRRPWAHDAAPMQKPFGGVDLHDHAGITVAAGP